jgi:hypothetical protein
MLFAYLCLDLGAHLLPLAIGGQAAPRAQASVCVSLLDFRPRIPAVFTLRRGDADTRRKVLKGSYTTNSRYQASAPDMSEALEWGLRFGEEIMQGRMRPNPSPRLGTNHLFFIDSTS